MANHLQVNIDTAGFAGLGRRIAAFGPMIKEKRQEMAKADFKTKAAELYKSGDMSGLSELMIQNPELRQGVIDTQRHISSLSQQSKVDNIKSFLTGAKTWEQAIRDQSVFVKNQGGDPGQSEAMMNVPEAERKKLAMAELALYDSDAANTLMKLEADQEKTKFTQGTGKMSGYAFNPDDGTYALDPKIKASLVRDAANLADKEQLSVKDVVGINNKVSSLVSGVRDIHTAANDLDVLKGSSSPAAQIAAVFKFMKALDPTSTVRESELGLVYGAEGAAQGMANQINKLLGEGQLSPAGFADIVNTAKLLANSAITASSDSVGSYLSVIEGNLSPRQFQKMKERVPAPFDMKIPTTDLPQTNKQGWALMTDSQGNRAYVGPNGQIEEVP